jgi:murein DD-endopeptidase MepM/ murein hydrolase activator NlpD
LSVGSPPARQGENPDNEPAQPQERAPRPEAQVPAVPDLEKFADGSKMSWPVVGEVIMPFSMNSLVYDQTLEQFRTNDSISIAAVAGTQVRAAADGVVVSVKSTRELGNAVVVDNGNGWTTTYSQLQDGVLVKEGDVVKKDQVIGGVGNPSVHSVLLGNHLGLRIAKDDMAKNPLDLLSE